MPVSYYLSALFDILGFESVEDQRIAFYVFISVLWSIIVINYKNIINKWSLVIYPVFLCAVLPTYQRGTCILSEHMAGIGAIILFLEYMKYNRLKVINIISCFMISVSIILTFGTMFWLIYAIFMIALGVLISEIKNAKEKTIGIRGLWVRSCKLFVPLFLCVIIPWVILLVYYKKIGTLRAFYNGAYLLNVDIYPKYGAVIGSSVFTPFFDMFNVIGGFISTTGNINEWNYGLILKLIVLISAIIWIIRNYRSGNHVESIIILLFILELGIRGSFAFHGTQFVEVCCLLTTDYLIKDNLPDEMKFFLQGKKIEKCYLGKIIVLLLFLVVGLNGISKITYYEVNRDRMSGEAKILHNITKEDEEIWSFTFANDVFMIANRYYTVGYPQVPWMWEMYEDEFYENCNNPPRVIVYAEDHGVWGYIQSEYAPEIGEFINDYYTRYGETRIFIRNDCYDEAINEINSYE